VPRQSWPEHQSLAEKVNFTLCCATERIARRGREAEKGRSVIEKEGKFVIKKGGCSQCAKDFGEGEFILRFSFGDFYELLNAI
jgi:hypothetical protein